MIPLIAILLLLLLLQIFGAFHRSVYSLRDVAARDYLLVLSHADCGQS